MKNNYNLTKHFYRYTYNTKTLKSQKKKFKSKEERKTQIFFTD